MISNPTRALTVLLASTLLLTVGACPPETGKTPKPILTITSPSDGFMTTATLETVTGAARRGGSEIVSLTVNGVSVLPLAGDPQDGTWSIDLAIDRAAIFNPVYVEMTLAGGLKLRKRVTIVAADPAVASFVNDGDFSLESIAMRLNDRGLDEVEPVVESLVNLDPATLVPPGTQVIDEYCYADTTFGCAGTADAYVSGSPPPSISGFNIDVDSQTNHIDGVITLNDLFLKANVVDGNVGIGFSCDVTATATTTTIDGNYGLAPDAVDPTFVDVSQQGNVAVAFGSFNDNTSCGGIFGGIIEFFIDVLIGSFEDQMRVALQDFLNMVDGNGNTPIAAGIEVALADIDITGPLSAVIGVTLDAELFDITEDTAGITLGNDSRFVADPVLAGNCSVSGAPCSSSAPCPDPQVCLAPGMGQCVSHPEAPDYAASYSVNETFPSFGATTPMGQPYGLGLCLSTAAFNQLLKAEMECGLLTFELAELEILGMTVTLTGAQLAPFIPEILMFPPTTEYEFALRPTVAGVVTGNAGPGGELAELRLSGLHVRLRDVAGEYASLLTVIADASVGLDVGFSAGTLTFALAQPDPMDVDVSILTNVLGANETGLPEILEALLVVAVPQLGEALEGFPLPEFFGLQLVDVEVGKAGEFMSLYLDLAPL